MKKGKKLWLYAIVIEFVIIAWLCFHIDWKAYVPFLPVAYYVLSTFFWTFIKMTGILFWLFVIFFVSVNWYENRKS